MHAARQTAWVPLFWTAAQQRAPAQSSGPSHANESPRGQLAVHDGEVPGAYVAQQSSPCVASHVAPPQAITPAVPSTRGASAEAPASSLAVPTVEPPQAQTTTMSHAEWERVTATSLRRNSVAPI